VNEDMTPGPPRTPPIGVKLASVAKAVSRAFDDALAAANGSRPLWLIFISLKTRRLANQQELAGAVGIQGATLTHHLNAMEADGLVTRRRDPDNRRVHQVELTAKGEAAFQRMRGAVQDFDRRLRAGIPDAEITRLAQLLDRLQANVAAGPEADGGARR
jgi:MarR family transcriptional regulator, transcriptional regulator for hemolysin